MDNEPYPKILKTLLQILKLQIMLSTI